MLRSIVLAALVGASSVVGLECSADKKCPKDSPCCSVYGECGVGAFCLGGCDPLHSFGLDSCVPAPVCRDSKRKWNNPDKLEGIVDISKYLGDADKADWVAQGEPAAHKDGVLLTMPRQSVGTVLSSTSYMWYGNVKARMRTSRGRGVVTAFILFSDVKDEIDYEWVGVDLKTSQTNFYFQGIPNYENSANISLSDTFRNWHDYEIKWTPDKIEWLIDGQVGRTVERKDTWNKTSNQWEFPQTPARVQLSIWPGGLASNAQGTIDWAGGEIDWDHEDVRDGKYFYAAVSDVEIQCFEGRDGLGTNNKNSYIYKDERGTNDTVVDSDKKTVLASLQGTGTDMDAGKKDDDDKTSGSKPSNTATIPGGSNANSEHDRDEDEQSDNDSGNDVNDSDNSAPSGDVDRSNCDVSSFNQDCSSGSNDEDDSGNGNGSGSGKSSASALAIIIAGCALYWL